jgi:hypothetical protein
MANSMQINDKIITVGDELKATKRAEGAGLCAAGDIVKVVAIIGDNMDHGRIGVRFPKARNAFHNLDGATDDNHGYWFVPNVIPEYFETHNNEFVIKEDFIFKSRNLKGMKCRWLNGIGRDNAMVEFDECVGGGSADGTGRSGHCVIVPTDRITIKENVGGKCQKNENGKV